ncbi:MAG TPA: hypothetical protein VF813_03395 [Anaerolineaceae bacterium]
MEAQLNLPTGKIVLVVGPHAAQEAMLELAGGLVSLGHVRVLDGGNQFNAYYLARALRRRSAEAFSLLERVTLSRAFTCYQMETMLAESRGLAAPTIILDLLSTFYDESVPLPERLRLLEHCTDHLYRLSRQAPLAVGARPGGPGAERMELFAVLREAADLVWEIGTPDQPQPAQPALF